jgi:hypothetical protein
MAFFTPNIFGFGAPYYGAPLISRPANIVPTMNYPVRVNGMNMAMPLVINTTKTEKGDKIDFDDLLKQLAEHLNKEAITGNKIDVSKINDMKDAIRNLIKSAMEGGDSMASKYVYAEPADIDRFNKNMKYMIDNSKSQTGGALFGLFGRPAVVAPVVTAPIITPVIKPITVSPVVLGVSVLGPAIIMPDFSFGLGLVFKNTISVDDLNKEFKTYIERVFKNIKNHADAIKTKDGDFKFYSPDEFESNLKTQIKTIIENNISQYLRHRFTGDDDKIKQLGNDAYDVYKVEFTDLCKHIKKICQNHNCEDDSGWKRFECDNDLNFA